jgi:hypothetical protein
MSRAREGRVFGLGLGRTGTLTLSRALQKVRRPVRHSLGPLLAALGVA